MIKIAIIGVGSMGQNHARIYFNDEDTELVAVADVNKEQAERIAKKYNTKVYQDYKRLLDSEEIDAVSIAVPTTLHKEVALYALEKKKHVLLEKPIANKYQEAQEILESARKKQVKLMIGHVERFNPAIIELKKRLDQGELGEIYKIDVQRIGPFPKQITDVGVIVDLSVHDLDIISYLLNSHPIRIYAEHQQRLHPHHEDSVTALIRYDNGVLADLNINYLSPQKVRQLRVFGKKGMFAVNYLDQELYFYENHGFSGGEWNSVAEGEVTKIVIPKKEPLQVEIEAFLHCIREDKETPVSGEQGLYALRLANCLLQSAREKNIIIM